MLKLYLSQYVCIPDNKYPYLMAKATDEDGNEYEVEWDIIYPDAKTTCGILNSKDEEVTDEVEIIFDFD